MKSIVLALAFVAAACGTSTPEGIAADYLDNVAECWEGFDWNDPDMAIGQEGGVCYSDWRELPEEAANIAERSLNEVGAVVIGHALAAMFSEGSQREYSEAMQAAGDSMAASLRQVAADLRGAG